MGYDHANQLFLMHFKFKRIAQNDGTDEKRGIITQSLWTQQNKDEWTHLGDMVDDHVLNASGDSSSKGIVVVYASHQGIFLRCHSNIYGWSDAIQIESYYSLNPAYPSVAMISEKKVVVAYSSKEGVFAETLNIEDI